MLDNPPEFRLASFPDERATDDQRLLPMDANAYGHAQAGRWLLRRFERRLLSQI
jgi:hypothetical protein